MRGAHTIVACAAVALGAWLAVAPAQAAFPGKNGKIAFFRQQPQDLFAVDPDGGNLAQLTDTPGSAAFPAWSADGSKIAFTYGESLPVGSEIYVINADGSGMTRVTNNQFVFDGEPTWSPGGDRLAFSQTNFGCQPDRCLTNVAVVNADGTGEHVLCCGSGTASDPSWSPDGSRIAFTYSPNGFSGPYGLWIMNADGTDPHRVCCDGLNVYLPDWSPDGNSILVQNRQEFLMRVSPDGTGLTTVYAVPDNARLFDFAGSPAGTEIVFSRRDPDDGITPTRLWVVNSDGSDAHPVTDPQGSSNGDAMPTWQPIPGPRRADYPNAESFCRATHEFLGASEFASRYGQNGNGANAFGKCVSLNR
jgi:dipeptidyl aminopeptidase/acylaminoacyl peptidase